MKHILFLNLTAFSQTGGLEKFNKCFLKALNNIEKEESLSVTAASLYDTLPDEKYYPQNKYSGYNKNRLKFVSSCLRKGAGSDLIVLGHINLAIVGFLIKKLFPRKKIILICHGIEVWEDVSYIKKYILQHANKIFAVSEFTKTQLFTKHHVSENKISVFHNTIDPYFEVPDTFTKSIGLQERYNLKHEDFVLFTLCRLSSKEKYKGYDQVIKLLPDLLKKYPNVKYIIAGKYDDEEKKRLDIMISSAGVQDNVILTGFLKTDEIIAHYQLADTYIMPSRKEGFGIVFIEAMVCGVRVIAGNKDGSVDALKNGELGLLVDPDDTVAITQAITTNIITDAKWDTIAAKDLQYKTIQNFGFDAYTLRLKSLLANV